MAEAKFYTYIHRRGDTGEVFYVGKGSGQRAGQASSRNTWWKNIAKLHGHKVEIVAYWDVERDALDHECALIAEYRASGAQLVNATDGGDGICGYRHTPETKEKIAEAGRGHSRKHSPETKAMLSEIGTGRKATAEAKANMSASRKGRKLSEAHKKSVSDALKGKPAPPMTDEHRRNISESLKGKRRAPFSEQHRSRIAEAGRGRTPSEETRKKLSEARKGRAVSAEQRQKLSDATRKYWERVRLQRGAKGQLELSL